MKKVYIVFVSVGKWDYYDKHPIQAFSSKTKVNKFIALEKKRREKRKKEAIKEKKKISIKLDSIDDVNDKQFSELWNRYTDLDSETNYNGIFIEEVDLEE